MCGAYGIRCLLTVWTPSFNHLSDKGPSLTKPFYSYAKAFVLVPAPNTPVEIVLDLSPPPATVLVSTTRKMPSDIYPVDCLLSYISDR